MSMDTQLLFTVCLARIRAHGWDPLVPTATGVYDGPQGAPRYFIVGVNIRGTTCLRELGGHALCGEGSDWLGSMTGPHTKEVWTGKIARLCSNALISPGRMHLCRV
jgi:hypothetical protein